MSVSDTFQLPNQPTTGDAVVVPLGGDGFKAPRLAYMVNKYSVTGDATAGSASLELEMDPRFVSVVAYVTLQVIQASTTDSEFRMTISSDFIGEQVDQGDQTAISATIAAFTFARTWIPAPVLLPGGFGTVGNNNVPRITMKMLNVDTDDYQLSALIYCFDIRAREIWSSGQLLFNRGSN